MGAAPVAKVVAGRVLRDLDAVLVRLGEAFEGVPEYAALGADVITTEVLPVTREIVGAFLEAVLDGRDPDVRDLPVIAQMARRRLEMGVPLEPMLHVYRIAGTHLFDAVVAAAGPGEEPAVAEVGRAWMEYIDHASSAAASAYLTASHERLRRVDAQRGALLDALLAAADASDVAAVASGFAVSLAASYVPVLADAADVTTRIDRIVEACPPGTLSGFRGSRVLLLVPERLPDLRPVLRQARAATLAHGLAAPPGGALAAELRRTEALLALAVARGALGVFGPDDLLVEQLLAGDPRVAAVLRRTVLEPLRAADRDGAVEATLRSFLETGSVPATARREHVHANTVSYRLQRVAARTGFDPRVPRESAVLVLALAAPDL